MKQMTAALLLLLLVARPASAQSLKLPETVFLASAAADWSSTAYCFQSRAGCHETNPLLNWAEPHPVGMIALGAAADLGTLYALHRTLGVHHPALMRVGLYSYAALRVYVASANLRDLRRH